MSQWRDTMSGDAARLGAIFAVHHGSKSARSGRVFFFVIETQG
jgi:hypothetical protein